MKKIIDTIIQKDLTKKSLIQNYSYTRDFLDSIEIKRPFKAILGLRGVGKTTLLTQLAIKFDGLYISLDDLILKGVNLYELLVNLNKTFGYSTFLLDEIQNISKWDYYLKDLYELTDFKIVFSGSSLIELHEKSVDLSRRVVTLPISPLSFREYLLFKEDISLNKISFDELLDVEKRTELFRKVYPLKEKFDDYLTYGAYPFSLESSDVDLSFKNILEKTFYQDFVKIKNISEEDITICFKILKYIALGSDEISYTNLSNDLHISKNKVYALFDLLEKSQLVIKIDPKLLGGKLLRKHPKFMLLLPIRYLVNKINGFDTNVGDLREDFFLTSVFYMKENLRYIKRNSLQSDFYLNEYIFEIGGKGETKKQLKNFQKSYLVKDSFENEDKIIPLILFGFLF